MKSVLILIAQYFFTNGCFSKVHNQVRFKYFLEYFEIHGFEPNLIQMFSMVVENRCDRTDHNLIFWFQISDIVFPFIFTDPFFDNRNIVKVVIIKGNIADLIRGLTLKYTAYDMQHNQCSIT